MCFDIILTNFIKAFEKVDYSFFEKLHYSGIKQILFNLMKSYLVGHTERIRVDGALSRENQVTSGGPQGSILVVLLIPNISNTLPDD